MAELLNYVPSYALKDISENEVNALIDQIMEKTKNNKDKLSELTLECTSLLTSAQNKSIALSEQGIFKRLICDVTGKNRKIQNAILDDNTNALYVAQTVINKVMLECNTNSDFIMALNARVNAMYREFKDNQNYVLEQVAMLRKGFVALYTDQNLMPPEIKHEPSLFIDPRDERPYNKKAITSNENTESKYMHETEVNIKSSYKPKKTDDRLEDPKLKTEIEALRRKGYSEEKIEKQYGKLYIGLKTTDSYTPRRLKFNPPIQPLYNEGFIKNLKKKSDYEKKLRLFEESKKKIEEILSYVDGYIIDKEWIYFIDKFTRKVEVKPTERFNFDFVGNTHFACDNEGGLGTVYGDTSKVYKDEIYYCLCRIRLDASKPQETVFRDVKVRSSININNGMIYFTDSKNNQRKIHVPS